MLRIPFIKIEFPSFVNTSFILLSEHWLYFMSFYSLNPCIVKCLLNSYIQSLTKVLATVVASLFGRTCASTQLETYSIATGHTVVAVAIHYCAIMKLL